MSDTNTTQNNDAPNKNGNVPRKMSELLPLVAKRLQVLGIAKVWAHYEGELFTLMFASTKSHSVPDLTAVMMAEQIKRALKSILQRRYPGAATSAGASGFFEWDLAADTLRHEHVTTHEGI